MSGTVQPQAIDEERRQRVVLIGSGALLLAAFAPTLVEMVNAWIERPEYSHGFLMPPVAAWLLWERRSRFAALRPRPSPVGLVFLAICLAVLLVGEMRLFAWGKAFAFVGALGAVAWSLYGGRAVRLALPALIALALMCPFPERLEVTLTLPLKRIAAVLATGLLDLTGIGASLDGNVIHLPGIDSLWVADACSGIRSLISLFSLAVLAGLVWERHWALRLAVIVSSIPIAVFVNAVRIWLTGYLAHAAGADAAQGFFHFFEGIVLFLVAALLLGAWAWFLARAFTPRDE